MTHLDNTLKPQSCHVCRKPLAPDETPRPATIHATGNPVVCHPACLPLECVDVPLASTPVVRNDGDENLRGVLFFYLHEDCGLPPLRAESIEDWFRLEGHDEVSAYDLAFCPLLPPSEALSIALDARLIWGGPRRPESGPWCEAIRRRIDDWFYTFVGWATGGRVPRVPTDAPPRVGVCTTIDTLFDYEDTPPGTDPEALYASLRYTISPALPGYREAMREERRGDA